MLLLSHTLIKAGSSALLGETPLYIVLSGKVVIEGAFAVKIKDRRPEDGSRPGSTSSERLCIVLAYAGNVGH